MVEGHRKETRIPEAHIGQGNNFIVRAQQASKEMDSDLKEAQIVLKKYVCESREIHVQVEEWLSSVYREFEAQRERIKLVLQKKWQSNQLAAGQRQKELLCNVAKLEEFCKGFAELVERLSQHIKVDSDGVVEFQKDALRAGIDDFIANLREMVDSIVSIFSYRRALSTQHRIFLQNTERSVKFLDRESKLNQKRLFTIVIIGLEKAGTLPQHNTIPQQRSPQQNSTQQGKVPSSTLFSGPISYRWLSSGAHK